VVGATAERTGNRGGEPLRRWALGLPEQLAHEAPGLDVLQAPERPPRLVLVAGMGGSGVSGKFLEALSHEKRTPVVPWSWPGAPRWLSRDDALLAVSHSGETAETLAAFRDGIGSGATVVAVCSGGKLGNICGERGLPVLIIPGGMPPRAAFGYLLGTALRAVERLTGERLWEPGETVETLGRLRDGLGGDDEIDGLARELKGRPVAVYGTCPLTAAAALRLKQQLNENAKMYAWCGSLPEAAHNEIEGAGPGEPPRRLCLTLTEPPPLDDILRDGVHTITLKGEGPDLLTAALGLVLRGDLLSLALARERGVEPGPIARIEEFKRRT
jgi:glucose/mannose-6-phosphate isomerase